MARVALTLLICLCWAADSAAQPSVRARLFGSAQATRQLLKSDRTGSGNYVEDGIDRNNELMPRRHPLKTDVPKYTQQRPWTRDYTVRYGDSLGLPLAGAQAARWPTPDDGPALRALLADQDASVRSLAVEALATLHDPDDLERIAALLNDHATGVPALGWEPWMNSFSRPYEQSKYDLVRSWDARRVSSYARVALRLMTGRDFNAASFAAWHGRNHSGRLDFWYWDIRLRQKLADAAADSMADGGYYERRREAAAMMRPELRDMPAEVEAKACLLSYEHYLGPCNDLRITPARLLDLLDRKDLWADIDWDDRNYFDAAYDTKLATEIFRVSDTYFTASDVPRLSAMLAREQSTLWALKAPGHIAISKLLPPADAGNRDAPDTREGHLRNAVRETNGYGQSELARHLFRLGAERHWPFLEPLFFAEADPFKQSPLRYALLDELGKPPLTPEKRSILTALVLDDRFASLWTRADIMGGDGWDRDGAARAVNVHAGREVLNVILLQDLFLYGTTRSEAALARVQAIVRESLAAK